MWQVAAMMAVGTIAGAMEGDDIMRQAEQSADELELEGKRTRKNAYGEAKDTYVGEQLASGTDTALETASNVTTGMSEYSGANQLLAANRQAALAESKAIMEEGDRMNKLYQDRAKTTKNVGRARAQKALVNGMVGGATQGYAMGNS